MGGAKFWLSIRWSWMITSNSLRLADHTSAAENRMLNTWRNRPSSRPAKQSQARLEQKESEREVGFSFVVRINTTYRTARDTPRYHRKSVHHGLRSKTPADDSDEDINLSDMKKNDVGQEVIIHSRHYRSCLLAPFVSVIRLARCSTIPA
jgi:hypothetical protein